ncbi:CDP-alcohol phosphatidyltransferase family protein [Nonomuraea sp. NPDC049152]|uniref:CDP-alcohol phosphatidyltransferase family protein n=1 Tax=Nonomuraea sp. NPDC049152 TaxID=3154350 RepID=UPI0033EF817F
MSESTTIREGVTAAAVVLATTPAARLSCADGTLLDRINDQLVVLPVRDVHVVPQGGGLGADLRGVAKIARICTGAVVLLPADLIAHTEALAVLMEHPARGTGALVSSDAMVGPLRPPVRIQHARVVAAGSSFHVVPEANATFRGVLQVGEADLGTLADIADELAELADTGRLGPVTPIETIDLLLVGLVRSGVPVRAAQIGRLHADRVTAQSAADLAVTRLADVDEVKVRLDTAVKSDDGFFATYFVSSWSPHLVRLAARLGLTPNAVTGISVGMAVLSAVWFSAGTRDAQVVGAALLLLSFVLDCVDGQLARFTRTFTPLGAWVDGMADRFKEYVVYIGLALGYTAGLDAGDGGPEGIWRFAVAAMILQTLRHSTDFSYKGAVADAKRIGAAWARPPRSLLESADGGRFAVPQQGVLGLAQRLERESLTRWAKKVIVLPIGERMALIAVTAALFNAKITFTALLVWGGIAFLYQLVGKIARSTG